MDKLAEINQQTQVGVSTHVSPAAHPDAIASFGDVLCSGDGGPGQIGYSTGRSALKALYQASIDVDEAHMSLLSPQASGKRAPNGAPIASMEVPNERRAGLPRVSTPRLRGSRRMCSGAPTASASPSQRCRTGSVLR